MKKNENGFSILEALLLLVIAGLIIGVGWFVYSQRKSQPTATSTSITTPPKQETKQPTLLEYKSGTISFQYPSNLTAVDEFKTGNYATEPTWIEATDFLNPKDSKHSLPFSRFSLIVKNAASSYEQSLAASKSAQFTHDVTPLEVSGIKGYTYIVTYEGESYNAKFFADGKEYNFSGESMEYLLTVVKSIKRV